MNRETDLNGYEALARDAAFGAEPPGPLCNVVLLNGVFSADECRQIRERMADVPLDDGLVNGAEQSAARKSRVRFIEYDPTVWIFARLAAAVAQVNRKEFRFTLEPEMREGVQYSEYREGGHYGWHVDIGTHERETRKLSLVVQLNDDYEGGDLQFFPAQFVIPKKAGLVVAFPSFAPHRVAPVTAGIRYSLAAWVHGTSRFT